MALEIQLEGLYTPGGNEERSLAHVVIDYNNNQYKWQIYIPPDVNLVEYLETVKPSIQSEIDSKEMLWQSLDPKTKTIENSSTGEMEIVDIRKEEIVKPDVPDYYALRRNEYPKISDQLDAIWKGPDSSDYQSIINKILEIKNKYPKP
jgi:hypothetical protein